MGAHGTVAGALPRDPVGPGLEGSTRLLEPSLLVAIFGAVLGWSIAEVSVGWHHTISGPFQNGFRQSQTALTAVRLAAGGPFLAYETPVVGPPWSIPFEFPLYQYLVAMTARWLHIGIVPAGRTVSVGFFYATLLPFWGLLGELRVRTAHRFVFLTLLLASPL